MVAHSLTTTVHEFREAPPDELAQPEAKGVGCLSFVTNLCEVDAELCLEIRRVVPSFLVGDSPGGVVAPSLNHSTDPAFLGTGEAPNIFRGGHSEIYGLGYEWFVGYGRFVISPKAAFAGVGGLLRSLL